MTTHWTPFFLVADVGAALERVLEAGGTALRDPFDVPERSVGPMQDPAGAPFSLWAPRADSRPPPSATGTWCMELATSDPAASRTFYAHVLGWTSAHAGGATTILGPDGPLGRIRVTDATPDWLAYLRVADVDEALRRAEAAGATRVRGGGGDGRVAQIIDPQGATLFLQQDA